MLQFLPALLAILMHGVSPAETPGLDLRLARAMVAIHQLSPEAAAWLEESIDEGSRRTISDPKALVAWWVLSAKVPTVIPAPIEVYTPEQSDAKFVPFGPDIPLPQLYLTASSRTRDGPCA